MIAINTVHRNFLIYSLQSPRKLAFFCRRQTRIFTQTLLDRSHCLQSRLPPLYSLIHCHLDSSLDNHFNPLLNNHLVSPLNLQYHYYRIHWPLSRSWPPALLIVVLFIPLWIVYSAGTK